MKKGKVDSIISSVKKKSTYTNYICTGGRVALLLLLYLASPIFIIIIIIFIKTIYSLIIIYRS